MMSSPEGPGSARGSALVVYLLFFAVFLLSVVAVDWNVGTVPIRSLLVIAALLILISGSPYQLVHAVLDHRKIYGIITVAGTIGLIVSLINRADALSLARQIVEIHIQALMSFTLAWLLIRQRNIASIAWLLVTVWSLSATTAIGQFFDVDLAWQARAALGSVMGDPDITRSFYSDRSRALGLSFTPVHLATQTCMVFATFFAYRVYCTSGKAIQRLDVPILTAICFALAVCVISGNRSPLLGFALLALIYLIIASPKIAVTILPLFIAALVAGFLFLDPAGQSALRVANISDGSATGRITLIAFGVHLFLENPLGYGLLFDSRTLAEGFIHQAMALPNPEIIRHFTLHNYYLQALNKYGVLTLLLILWILPMNRPALIGWMAFLPYLVHIFFHNAGPLSSDFLFWFCLPVVIAATKPVYPRTDKQAGPHPTNRLSDPAGVGPA